MIEPYGVLDEILATLEPQAAILDTAERAGAEPTLVAAARAETSEITRTAEELRSAISTLSQSEAQAQTQAMFARARGLRQRSEHLATPKSMWPVVIATGAGVLVVGLGLYFILRPKKRKGRR